MEKLSFEFFPDIFQIDDLSGNRRLIKGDRVYCTLQTFAAAAFRRGSVGHGIKKLLHDDAVTTGMAVGITEFDGGFAFIADVAVADSAAVEVGDDIAFAAMEVHSSLRNDVAHGAGEAHPDAVAELCNADKIIHQIGVIMERGGETVRVAPAMELVRAVFFLQMTVGGFEEVASAHSVNFCGQRLTEPFDQIKVVTAFFQNVRTGNIGFSPPVAHDISAVCRADVFIGFDGHQITEFITGEQLFYFAVKLRVTQHEAGGKKFIALFVSRIDILAVVNGGGEGFFGKDVFVCFKRFQNVLLVEGVGRKHHHPLDAGEIDRFPAAGTVFGGTCLPRITGEFHLFRVGVINGNDFDISICRFKQPVDDTAGTVAAGNNCNFYFFTHIFLRSNVEKFLCLHYIIHRKFRKQMDKKRMNNDKKCDLEKVFAAPFHSRPVRSIEMDEGKGFHRIAARMPEFQKEYGLWLISGNIGYRTKVNSFASSCERSFDFYSLSQMYSGSGMLEINGIQREISPGGMILICPGDRHRYGGYNNSSYCEDSICFCGNIADALHKKGILRSGAYPGSPIRMLKPLVEQMRTADFRQTLRCTVQFQELLLDIFCNDNSGKTPVDSLLETLRNSPAEHWWRVSELADMLNVSEDTLRREFYKATGMLPKNYIERMKLQQSARMLLSGTLPVKDVAMYFGYRDAYHFSRRFKKYFGLSPEHYRKSGISGQRCVPEKDQGR